MKRSNRGYFLLIAVIFILIMGLLGVVLVQLFSSRAFISPALFNGFKAFYLAESGIEIGTRILTRPELSGTTARLGCSDITGVASVTNASLLNGRFTITAAGNAANFAVTSLSSAITTTSPSIAGADASSFDTSGFILVDREIIKYAAISGNTFLGVIRGTSGTIASSHAVGAAVSQYQCSLSVSAGLPTLTAPQAQRQLQWNVQLQDGWAVGNSSGSNDVATNWNRTNEIAWTNNSFAPGTASNLNSIDMLSSGDFWIVGDEVKINTPNFFTIIHSNGITALSFFVAGACAGQDLLGVSAVSSQEVWAVGVRYKPTNCSSGNNRYTILKWNGSAWAPLVPTAIPADNNNNQNLQAVHVIDTDGNGVGNIGFAVGLSGQILRYNGTTWAAVTSPTTRELRGVYVVSTTEAWAVGNNGTIIKWNGTTWSTFTSPTTVQLNSIAMLDTSGNGTADFDIAVGNSGRIIVYNGTSWSNSSTSGNNLFGVNIVDTNDAWAVGASGTALHWNGSTWTSFSSGVTTTLNAISIVPNPKPASGWQQVFR